MADRVTSGAQPVVTDYEAVLDVLGEHLLTTIEVAKLAGIPRDSALTKLHAANADGWVELLAAGNGSYRWRRRSLTAP